MENKHFRLLLGKVRPPQVPAENNSRTLSYFSFEIKDSLKNLTNIIPKMFSEDYNAYIYYALN